MKCLVSGATGFIGRHLCQQLVDQGAAVTALSCSGGSLDCGTVTVPVDLASGEPDAELLRGVDVVFHLAGIAHRQAEASAYQQLNYQATLRLARLAAAQGVGCFVFLSSVKAMGRPSGPEKRKEEDCVVPLDAYGLSKWQAECALREEFSSDPMSIVILRPALVYGKGNKGNLEFLAKAMRWGLPRPPQEGARSMLALHALVALLGEIAEHPPQGVHTWIACDNEGYSTRYLYDRLREAAGRNSGLAWLPRWGWYLAAKVIDLLRRRGDEPTFQKLFGTELYDNSALSAAMDWLPAGSPGISVADLAGHAE